jgi:CRP-like cAMP-binding protein
LSLGRKNEENAWFAPASDKIPGVKAEEILKKAPLFRVLSEPELQAVATRAVVKRFDTGQTIFSEGQPCEGLYVVAQGRLRIFKTSANGREQVLTEEAPGASVAELPVFDGGPYPASAVAIEPCETLFLSRRDFRALCLEHPELALKVLAVVGNRLRNLVGIIEELSFTTVRQRLIAYLLRAAEEHGKKGWAGVEFDLSATHQELANRLGTVRELVSRNLSRLQAERLIATDGRHIIIPDVSALAAQQEQ